MPEHQAFCHPLKGKLRRLRGQTCWGVHYSRQLNLSLSLGKPRLKVVREPGASKSLEIAKDRFKDRLARRGRRIRVTGEWWLWVFMAHWRIVVDGVTRASSASSQASQRDAMCYLEGQRLTDIAINPITGATRFSFDLNTTLEVRRLERTCTDDLWSLYEPSGYVYSVVGNGTFGHVRGSVPGSQIIGRPLREDV